MNLIWRGTWLRQQLSAHSHVGVIREIELPMAFSLPAAVVSIYIVSGGSEERDRAHHPDTPGIHDALNLYDLVRASTQ